MRWRGAVPTAIGLLVASRAALADEAGDAAVARAEQDCARAAERAQDLRGSGKLLEASIELRACVRATCPAFLRQDCATWSSEVDASLPTVVVRARDGEDRELTAVRVSVDGSPWLARLDGLAKPLDPGAHRLRFERTGGAPLDEDVVLYEGEKLRPIDVRWAPDRRPAERDARVLPWVLGGAGVAVAGAGAVLTAIGVSEYHDLQQSCGRTGSCARSEVDAQRARLWVGNIALVVGAVAIGAATWVWLTPTPGGASIQVSGRI